MSTGFDTGQRFGAYTLGKLVGRGGMGVVYEAQHVHLGRVVALKLLAPDLSESPDFRARFLRESRLAATIEHPGIVTVYDAGEVQGVLFIAMRYVRGTDLAATLAERGRLDLPETVSIIEQVGSALDAAHAAGLVHRDVKPANVMIEEGRCYLTDFGLTKQAAETHALTMSGQFLGTADYVAPEQIEGRSVDGRTDEYALGCMLFECLTGARPYRRDATFAVLYAHLHEPPPRPTEMRPELPPAFDEVVGRAMAKAIEERYATCGDLGAAARHAAGLVGSRPSTPDAAERPTAARPVAQPTAARPVPPPRARAGTELPTAPLPRETPTGATQALRPARPRRRRGRALVLGLAVPVVAGGVAAALVLSKGSSSKGPHVAGTPLQVSKRPAGVASAAGRLWVTDLASSSVIRLDPDGSGRTSFHVGREPWGLATNSTSVWVASGDGNRVTRIDTRTASTRSISVPGHPLFLAADDSAVYVARADAGSVSRLDARTGSPIGSPIKVGTEPLSIVMGGGSVWVANRDSGTVSRISGGRVVQTIDVGGAPVGLLYHDGVLWVANRDTDAVQRIAIGSNRVASTPVGHKPYALTFAGHWVWVTNRIDGTVMRLDPASGRRVGAAISVPGDPIDMTTDRGDVLVTANLAGTLTRITP